MSELAEKSAINAIADQIAINDEKNGQEFYRFPYDKALHIEVALNDAGYKIVRMTTGQRQSRAERQELDRKRRGL